ncbi:nuclease-related domain-containing protein [Azospirillum sp.]|uniref:nuclease-related domain-containing protein n=1 Tax=Azospirillum sp. TaxID=34012 RepID=UPI002D64F152|nr:nuclease-related domain-containing protein [Azospirillum sp.]HYD68869.1 nuclease-related domain-containing protein [Azospirillum sp.]
MILKNFDDREPQIAELSRLLTVAPADRRDRIDQELRSLRAGIKGENGAAYYIDFAYKNSKNYAVIHDLRLEIDGFSAQIDHLIINRHMNVYVIETKTTHAGIKITEDGEFLRWNDYKKTYEGMPSPIAQNERHIAVLKKAFEQIGEPKRLGVRMQPTLHSFIAVDPKVRIDRPKNFDSSRIVKADVLQNTISKQSDNDGMLSNLGSIMRAISSETLEMIGHKLVALHRPASVDYATRFGLKSVEACVPDAVTRPPVTTSAVPAAPRFDARPPAPRIEPQPPAPRLEPELDAQHRCRCCSSTAVKIQYGKYGYYFKCSACGGNSALKLNCLNAGHKEKIRKDGERFYRDCPECKTSMLFFTNPT